MKRISPTEKQKIKIDKFNDDELISMALESLKILNRRVKIKRDNYNQYRNARFSNAIQSEIEEIYSLKNDVIECLLDLNIGQLFFFDHDYHRWFIYKYNDYSFHQPEMKSKYRRTMINIKAHDPYQPVK